MITVDRVKELAHQGAERVRQHRHHIHANPELSFQEKNTAAYIAKELARIGVSYKTGVAGTGIVAEIKGINAAKTIALRADMDALPIQEANDVSYRSTVPGVMHACGHDVHSSMLLGVAEVLKACEDKLQGTVRLIFQPGEEKLPGGASLMIKEGVLQNPAPANIIGQHVMPFLPVGKVGFRKGMYMASCDELYITVKGKGGHGAFPHLVIDPVLIASHLVVAMQQIVSRHCPPEIPSVVSFGKIEAKGATNVIPSEVRLEGTFRTFNEEWRKQAHQIMRDLVENLCKSMGGSCDFELATGYPVLFNDEALTEQMINAAVDYMGADNVVDLSIWPAAEDFSFYSQHIPASFYRLGTRNEARGIISGVHTPTFDIDESAMEHGVGLMSWLAITQLQ